MRRSSESPESESGFRVKIVHWQSLSLTVARRPGPAGAAGHHPAGSGQDSESLARCRSPSHRASDCHRARTGQWHCGKPERGGRSLACPAAAADSDSDSSHLSAGV